MASPFSRIGRRPARGALLAILALSAAGGGAGAEVTGLGVGGFVVTHTLTLPGSPEEIYDAMTGDISGWWDHHFSASPKRLFIEAKPGGGFWEIFDESGDGARHAVVLLAQRGRKLVFEGPLGLSGNAVSLAVTYEFAPEGEATKVTVTCRAAGQYEKGWDAAIDGVWRHFLFERLKPHVEAGRHRAPAR